MRIVLGLIENNEKKSTCNGEPWALHTKGLTEELKIPAPTKGLFKFGPTAKPARFT